MDPATERETFPASENRHMAHDVRFLNGTKLFDKSFAALADILCEPLARRAIDGFVQDIEQARLGVAAMTLRVQGAGDYPANVPNWLSCHP